MAVSGSYQAAKHSKLKTEGEKKKKEKRNPSLLYLETKTPHLE